jgi:hypothetical protein
VTPDPGLSESWLTPEEADDFLSGAPTPPYVTSPEQRRRWTAARAVATAVADGLGSPGEPLDRAFIWRGTRVLYFSPIPEDPPPLKTTRTS